MTIVYLIFNIGIPCLQNPVSSLLRNGGKSLFESLLINFVLIPQSFFLCSQSLTFSIIDRNPAYVEITNLRREAMRARRARPLREEKPGLR